MLRRILPLLAVFTLVPLSLADDKKEKKDEFKMSEDEKAVVEFTNAERKKANLPPLKPNPKLFEAARAHSANMAKQDKLEHDLDGKTFVDRVKDTGYKSGRGGENIGWNYQSPKDAVAGWMDSPPHKENILNKDYTEIGIGIAKNAKGEPYWTQVFGTPRDR